MKVPALLMAMVLVAACSGGNGGSAADTSVSDAGSDLKVADGTAPDVVEPDKDLPSPDPDAAEPDPDVVGPDPDVVEPDPDVVEPDPDVAEPEEDVVVPSPCTPLGGECGAGFNCLPNLNETALVCVEAGDGKLNEACAANTDCGEGLVCITWDDTQAFCRTFCEGGEEPKGCKGQLDVCLPWVEGLNFGVCLGDDCLPPKQGCPEGMRCSILLGGVFSCVPEGPIPVGGDCTDEECVAGAKCVSGFSGYMCTELCQPEEGCTQEGYNCLAVFDQIPDWGYCEAGCDPILQVGCDEGEGCYYEDPEVGSFLCWEKGSLEVGADCSSLVEFCEPGSDCFVDPGSDPFTYTCKAFCDDTHPCPTGTCQNSDLIVGVKLCL